MELGRFTFLYIAILTYCLFLAYLFIRKAGQNPSPIRYFVKFHFGFSFVYIIFSALLAFSDLTHFVLTDFLVGLFCYYAFHHPFGLNILGQVSRGFSLNICIALFNAGRNLSLDELINKYGDNKGANYVQQSRMEILRQYGFAKQVNGSLVLTTQGVWVVNLNRFILKLWNLNYL